MADEVHQSGVRVLDKGFRAPTAEELERSEKFIAMIRADRERSMVGLLEWSEPYDDDYPRMHISAMTPFGKFRISWDQSRTGEKSFIDIERAPFDLDTSGMHLCSVEEAQELCWKRYKIHVLACLRRDVRDEYR